MDRRKLHKSNGQVTGKNKQTAARTRANNRAAQQDAHRDLEVEEEVARPSRAERLKQWRLDKDAKRKQEEHSKRKPFVTVVKRGVFLETTNYIELNKQRRNKNAGKKAPTRPERQVQVVTPAPARNNENTLAVPDTPLLNTTFEMPDSNDQPVEDNLVASTEPLRSETSRTSNEEGLSGDVGAENANEVGNNDSNGTSNVVESGASNLNSTFEFVDVNEVNNHSIATTPTTFLSTSLNYVSPFVTLARGKGSARKEVKVRNSFYKLELSQQQHDSPIVRKNRAAGEYFRFQVNSETEKLKQKMDEWDKYRNENEHIDSVYLDQIAVAIGQTNLLLTKKFQQFMKLISQCEEGKTQPPVRPEDLEGFWSMVFMQVENCNDRFQKLVTLKENDWVEVDLLPVMSPKQKKNKRAGRKVATASVGIHKMIEEARKKLKHNRITATETSSSSSNDSQSFRMTLRQTPARLSLSAAMPTPKSIIKAKTPGQRVTKSVAFSFVESPAKTSTIKGTPKPKMVKRRASTSGIPTENESSTSEAKTSFLTPSARKAHSGREVVKLTPRRSTRRLFSIADK